MTLSICIEAVQFTKEYTNLRQLTDALYMIARHACDVKVAEVVVIGEGEASLKVAAILQFFITPGYLVRETFKGAWKRGLDKNIFSEARKCPPIRSLKCLKPWKREDNGSGNSNGNGNYFREGVAIIRTIRRGRTSSGKVARLNVKDRTTEWVNVGLGNSLKLENERVPFGVRVTVEVLGEGGKLGRLVSSKTAWGYCGYVVRGATDAAGVFSGSGAVAGEDGYSKVIGIKGKSTDTSTTTTISSTLPELNSDDAVLIAVNTLSELWDSRVETCSFLVADACVAGIALIATARSAVV